MQNAHDKFISSKCTASNVIQRAIIYYSVSDFDNIYSLKLVENITACIANYRKSIKVKLNDINNTLKSIDFSIYWIRCIEEQNVKIALILIILHNDNAYIRKT